MVGGAEFRETDVTYKAKANFSDLFAKVAEAQAAIAALRAAEKNANSDSKAENDKALADRKKLIDAIGRQAEAQKKLNDLESKSPTNKAADSGSTTGDDKVTQARTRRAKATEDAAKSEGDLAKADSASSKASTDTAAAEDKVTRARRDRASVTKDLSKAEGDLAKARNSDKSDPGKEAVRYDWEKKILAVVGDSSKAYQDRARAESVADGQRLSGLRQIESASAAAARAEKDRSDAADAAAGKEVVRLREVASAIALVNQAESRSSGGSGGGATGGGSGGGRRVFDYFQTKFDSAGAKAAEDSQRAITAGFRDIEHVASDADRSSNNFWSNLKKGADDGDSKLRSFVTGFGNIWNKIGGIVNGLPGGRGGLILGAISALPALYPLLSSFLNIVGPATAGVGALGTGIVALASNLGSLGAGLVGIVPLLATAVAGFATLKMAFSGIGGKQGSLALYDQWQTLKTTPGATPKQIQAAANAYKSALAELSKPAQQFSKWMSTIGDAFGEVQKKVQNNFFGQFVNDLTKINGLVKPLGGLLEAMATALGKVGDAVIKELTGSVWVQALKGLTDSMVPMVDVVGKTLTGVLDIFAKLSVAAMPFATKMIGFVNDVVQSWVKALDTPQQMAGFASFLDVIYQRFLKWWAIIKNVGVALFEYGKAMNGWGDSMVSALDRITQKWADMGKAAAQPNSGFRKYLEEIKPLWNDTFKLFAQFGGAIKKAMVDPSNIQGMDKIIKALGGLGTAVGGLLGTLTKGGDFSTIVRIVSDLVKILNDLLKFGGLQGLQAVWDILDKLLSFIDKLLNAPGVGQVLGPIVTALSVLAGLSFVGKFTHLFELFGWLQKMAGSQGVLKFLMGISGLGTLMDSTGITFKDEKNLSRKVDKYGTPLTWTGTPSKNDPLYAYNQGARRGDPIMEPTTITGDTVRARQAAAAEERAARSQGGYWNARYGTKMGAKGIPTMLGFGAAGEGYASGLNAGYEEYMAAQAMSPEERAAKGITPARMEAYKRSAGLSGWMGVVGPTSKLQRGANRYSGWLGKSFRNMSVSGRTAGGVGAGIGLAGLLGSMIIPSVMGGKPGSQNAALGSAWSNMASGAAQGAMFGSMIGPWGTLIGGAGGLIAGGLTSKGQNGKPVFANVTNGSNWADGARQIGGFIGSGTSRDHSVMGSLNNFVAPANKAIDGFFKGIGHNLADGGKQIVNFFRPAGKAFGDGAHQIVGFFRGVGKNFADGAKQIANFFKPAVKAFADGGRQIANFFKPAVKAFADGAHQIAGFFRGVAKNFADGARQIAGFFKGVAKNFADGARQIAGFFKGVAKNFADGAHQIAGFFKGVAKNFADGARQIANFFKPAVKAFADGARQIANFFKPVVKAFADGAHQIAGFFKGVVKNFADGARQIVGFFKGVGKFFNDAARNIGNYFKGVAKNFADGARQIANFFKPVGKFFADAAHNIANFFKGVVKNFDDGARQIVSFFKTAGHAIDTGWKNVVSFFRTSGHAIDTGWKNVVSFFHSAGNAVNTGWKNVVSFFHTAGNAVNTGWRNVVSFFRTVGNAVNTGWRNVVSFFHTVGSAVNTGWRTVVSFFRTIASAVRSLWSGVVSTFRGAAGTIKSAWNGVVGVFRSVGNGIGTAWNTVMGLFRTAAGIVSDAASTLSSVVGGFNPGALVGNFLHGIHLPTGWGATGGVVPQHFMIGGPVIARGEWEKSSTDTVPAMLTPGEFVLKKSIVDIIGIENLRKLNNGMTGYAQFLSGMFQHRRFGSSNPYISQLPPGLLDNPGLRVANSMQRSNGGGSGNHFGNIIITNPVPERASDTLPRTVRKLGYLAPSR